MAKKPDGGKRPIIVRREEVVEGGHHGGAWKVAYADFVTAMMAFFLLMWLLNATTEAQRRGLADYFTPNNLMSHTNSGSGQPFGGRTPYDAGSLISDRGAMTIAPGKSTATVAPDDADEPTSSVEVQPRLRDDGDGDPASAQVATRGTALAGMSGGAGRVAGEGGADGTRPDAQRDAGALARTGQDQMSPQDHAGADAAARLHAAVTAKDKAARDQADKAERAEKAAEQAEKAAFDKAAGQIRDAVRSDPTLSVIANQIAIDMTPAGLRIQLMDEDRLPMFPSGSATPNDRAQLILHKIAPILARMPEQISVSGHTDATPYRGTDKTNWELSAERANATRRLLVESGLPESRLRSVSGNADRDLLLPADPFAAANRRIAIVALRDAHPASP